jgi:hypothetical protein
MALIVPDEGKTWMASVLLDRTFQLNIFTSPTNPTYATIFSDMVAVTDTTYAAIDLPYAWTMNGRYTVTGSVTPDITGDYYENGTQNGYPAYERNDGAYWIWFETGVNLWIISATKGSHPAAFFYSVNINIVNTYTGVSGAFGTATVTADDFNGVVTATYSAAQTFTFTEEHNDIYGYYITYTEGLTTTLVWFERFTDAPIVIGAAPENTITFTPKIALAC